MKYKGKLLGFIIGFIIAIIGCFLYSIDEHITIFGFYM